MPEDMTTSHVAKIYRIGVEVMVSWRVAQRLHVAKVITHIQGMLETRHLHQLKWIRTRTKLYWEKWQWPENRLPDNKLLGIYHPQISKKSINMFLNSILVAYVCVYHRFDITRTVFLYDLKVFPKFNPVSSERADSRMYFFFQKWCMTI